MELAATTMARMGNSALPSPMPNSKVASEANTAIEICSTRSRLMAYSCGHAGGSLRMEVSAQFRTAGIDDQHPVHQCMLARILAKPREPRIAQIDLPRAQQHHTRAGPHFVQGHTQQLFQLALRRSLGDGQAFHN